MGTDRSNKSLQQSRVGFAISLIQIANLYDQPSRTVQKIVRVLETVLQAKEMIMHLNLLQILHVATYSVTEQY